MCIVCKDWKIGKLTNKEAIHALGELMSAASNKEMSHYSKVLDKIMEKEVPVTESDDELDKLWQEESEDF